MHPDAKSVGAHLDSPGSPLHALLDRARGLTTLQQLVRQWAGEPLGRSLHVANERDGIVVVFADSAAAFTQLRYRQQELLQALQARSGNTLLKLEIKMRPAAQNGR